VSKISCTFSKQKQSKNKTKTKSQQKQNTTEIKTNVLKEVNLPNT